jgi:hypothetical protein
MEINMTVQKCPLCDVFVLPCEDGQCPSCRRYPFERSASTKVAKHAQRVERSSSETGSGANTTPLAADRDAIDRDRSHIGDGEKRRRRIRRLLLMFFVGPVVSLPFALSMAANTRGDDAKNWTKILELWGGGCLFLGFGVLWGVLPLAFKGKLLISDDERLYNSNADDDESSVWLDLCVWLAYFIFAGIVVIWLASLVFRPNPKRSVPHEELRIPMAPAE